ncbi:Gti1/Pac2 family-domain-containing protein [Podospora appendiculata]|uniref:Gti1/Pac2 family-domain-containing protein n=1 Tax=Podospora appendiculata TaxID=314037 RepID=A0AAE0XG05_9PEZI|nr:Gti1/Pac2 family-domain-containing protein [Podospora appendiculata]
MAGNHTHTAQPLEATYNGFVGSDLDALILFEACLRGVLTHVPRRPHDREREYLIRSGNIFLYEENSSGIKRWTDGLNWSPSRIMGNFLIYRELQNAFPPGEKKKAMKKKPNGGGPSGHRNGVVKSEPHQHPRHSGLAGSVYLMGAAQAVIQGPAPEEPDQGNGGADLRCYVGSLTESYPFKKGGLMKKTLSVNHKEITHHLVCYYSIEDAIHHKLGTPSADPTLRGIYPRRELLTNQPFRAQVDSNVLSLQQHLPMAYLPPPPTPDGLPLQEGWHLGQQHQNGHHDMMIPHRSYSMPDILDSQAVPQYPHEFAPSYHQQLQIAPEPGNIHNHSHIQPQAQTQQHSYTLEPPRVGPPHHHHQHIISSATGDEYEPQQYEPHPDMARRASAVGVAPFQHMSDNRPGYLPAPAQPDSMYQPPPDAWNSFEGNPPEGGS